MQLKMLVVAVCLTMPIAGTAWAQGGGPVNPGSGPTAGGTVDTGPAAGKSGKMMKRGSGKMHSRSTKSRKMRRM